MNVKRAALYCRISQKDEAYDKVEVQERQLRKLAAENGYTVVDVFKDDGISAFAVEGRVKRRDQWEQLLLGIRAKKYDVVLAAAPDRLTRDTGIGAQFNTLCTMAGVFIHTKSAGKFDPASPQERALSTVMTAFAQMDIAVRRAKLQDRFEEETRLGNPLWGVRPFGYTLDRRQLHPTESKELRRAYDAVLDGKSLYSIMLDWNRRGITTTRGNKWAYGSLQNMLKRNRNAALMERHGEIVEGIEAQWPAIVSRAELEATIAILSNPQKKTAPGRKPKWLVPGLLRCGVCGSVMRSGTSTPPRAAAHPVYRCATKTGVPTSTGRHVTYKIEIADARVRAEVISALLFMPSDLLPKTDEPSQDPRSIEMELSEIRRKKQKLVEMALAPGWEGETTRLQSELRAAELDAQSRLEAVAQSSAKSSMDTALRQALWGRGTVSISDAAAVKIQLGTHFDSLDLSTRRELVKWLLDMEVLPGRDDDRLKIRHKIVTSLNEPIDA